MKITLFDIGMLVTIYLFISIIFQEENSNNIIKQIKKSEKNIIYEIQKAHQISRVKYLDDKLIELKYKCQSDCK